jgi:hypothetical protein
VEVDLLPIGAYVNTDGLILYTRPQKKHGRVGFFILVRVILFFIPVRLDYFIPGSIISNPP